MWNLDPKTLFWLLAVVQTAGIATACLARCWPAERLPGVFHGAFYALLALAGAANVLSLAISATVWLASSFLLAAMVLTATLDLGGSRRAAAS